ncbi:MAG: gamma subclass chorismate mutase AroQ [Alphaproteobacteria bacterium]|nr:gamma subclass chorismate mutase AroQ [Alphaproteobacteria bacterium]MBU0796073.1 gamma subclass chorismate mutase AroQ [Alphaproteobacteria bacterium]MBU0885776.1 gamma subclass chorismate mutase AroQ [Alphaproteobacteria bacterium]MBU1814479.1 gamma subclass chorismate mutase AroQ [Alphaproteobacteria bacterium]MBU2091021.1 gamma subclass chorismate mutase AroQ [Alphaproteobacteria bacterium]
MRFPLFLVALAIAALSFTPAQAGETELSRLAGLLDQRLALGVEVARTKWNSGQPIQDVPREEAVIKATVTRAGELGIDPALARDIITAQIAASRVLQEGLHRDWKAAGQGRFADALDLGRDLRPKFDAMGRDLLAALKEAESVLKTDAGRSAMIQAGTEAMAGRPQAVRDTALAVFR